MSAALSAILGAAYLLGSIPTGYLVARRLAGIDVRTAGSGNVGATNVARVVGKWPGIFVLIIDTLKGTLAVTWLPTIIGRWWGMEMPMDWRLAAAVAVIVGHDWPVWLRFAGGKGVATSLGVLLGLAPALAGWAVVVWGMVFACSRMVSLSSIVAAIAVPVVVAVSAYGQAWLICTIVLGLIAIIRHKSNIERMLHRTEGKFRAS